MARLWVLLIFIWYYAAAIAEIDNKDDVMKEESQRIQEAEDIPSDFTLPFKEDVYNIKIEEDNQPDSIYDNTRKKRSTDTQHSVQHKPPENTKKEIKREASNDNNFERSSQDEIKQQKGTDTKNNEDSSIIVDTGSMQDLRNIYGLISKQHTLLNKDWGLNLHDLENQRDYAMLRKCLQPVENKKSFSAWGGKRFINYDDQVYRKCLELLMMPAIAISPSIYRSPYQRFQIPFKPWNGKREADEFPKRIPFRAWGGKREKTEEGISPKRMPFRPWGGKRNPEVAAVPIYPKTDQKYLDQALLAIFNDGKRIHPKKTKFYSWGGKRNIVKPQYLPSSLDVFNTAIGSYDNLFKETLPPWQIYRDYAGDRNVGPPEIRSVGHRRQKFNSWGGKRSIQDSVNDYNEVKRTKFSSWGGKRGFEIDDDNEISDNIEESKRQFSAWGGKREVPTNYLNPDQKNYEEYKRKFSAWGGKRGIYNGHNVPIDMDEIKRKFSAWGGKRSVLDVDSNSGEVPYDFEEDKRKFSAWGGKRDDIANEDESEEFENDKRSFNAWGGKRDLGDDIMDGIDEDKRQFSAWGGKRDLGNDITDDIDEYKRKFSAWGGKRGVITEKYNLWGQKENNNEAPSYDEYKRTFSAWGGKK